jgi:hypothetical protein
MSDTPTDAAKEKPINDTGGGNAPQTGSTTTTTEGQETAGTTSQEGSD